jgi:16S rRNA processing protein RimM
MIRREDLIKIGVFKKAHGVRGEISFAFTNDSFDKCDRPFFFCELDGIFVPFLLEGYRFNSASTAFVKLKTVDSEEKARLLNSKEVYFSKDQVYGDASAGSFYRDYFIGFTIVDRERNVIGRITDVNDSTINALFVVDRNGEEILIPVTNEWIIAIDRKQKTLCLELPEGLLVN